MARSPESAPVREVPSGRLYIIVLRRVSCFETQRIQACPGGGADHDDIGTQTPRTISPQEPFYSVFTVLTVLKPTHRRTQHTRVNIFEQPLPHITQNSLVICVLPKYTKISTPPQRQLRFSTFTGTVNTVAGTTTTTTAASMIAATTPTHSDNM